VEEKGPNSLTPSGDDILIHSKTHEDHRKTLIEVLRRLKKHNLKIILEKYHFATTRVEYLGS